MKKIIFSLLILLAFSLVNAQSNIGLPNFSSPSGCTTEAEVIAFEINALNADSSIAAFAYMDFETGYNYSSDEGIVVGSPDSTFAVIDTSIAFVRTRVAQRCKIGCCKRIVKWSSWEYTTYTPPEPKLPTIEQLNINCSSACTAFIDYIEFCEPEPIPSGAVTVGIDLYENGTTLIENLEANSTLGGQISDGTISSELTVGNNYSVVLYYLDASGNVIYSESFDLTSLLTTECFPCGSTPLIAANDDPQGQTTIGQQYLIDVRLNDTHTNCAPITYTVSLVVNCTVVNNGDGTFDVTPLGPGNWSFTYTAICADGVTSDKATVSGTAVNSSNAYAANEGASAAVCQLPVEMTAIASVKCLTKGQASINNGGEVLLVPGGCNNFPIWISDTSVKLKVGETYNFKVKAGTNTFGSSTTSIIWDFGDGNTATGIGPTNSYTSAGIYNVSVSTTNCDGTLNTVVFTIEVVN